MQVILQTTESRNFCRCSENMQEVIQKCSKSLSEGDVLRGAHLTAMVHMTERQKLASYQINKELSEDSFFFFLKTTFKSAGYFLSFS